MLAPTAPTTEIATSRNGTARNVSVARDDDVHPAAEVAREQRGVTERARPRDHGDADRAAGRRPSAG